MQSYWLSSEKNCTLSTEGTTDAAAPKDALRGSRWSAAGPTQACSSSPTTRSTTTLGRRSATRSLAQHVLTTPRTARTAPRTACRSQTLKRRSLSIIRPRRQTPAAQPQPQPQAPPPQQPRAPATALLLRRWL